jgi:hypothetical protein
MTLQEKALKKLEVEFLAGAGPNSYTLIPSPATLSFIYGIETELTPFELTLSRLEKGETTTIELAGSELQSYFGSLYGNFLDLTRMHLLPADIYLQFTLKSYNDATPKEIVQAMAKAVGHGGCGGDCGCGCGG